MSVGIGVDIGATDDATAIAIVRAEWEGVEPRYAVKVCEWFNDARLSTVADLAYTYVDDALDIYPEPERIAVYLDANGLGRQVAEDGYALSRQRARVYFKGVIPTGGDNETAGKRRWEITYPRDLLVGPVIRGAFSRAVDFSGLPPGSAERLRKELAGLDHTRTSGGRNRIDHSSQTHDDGVFAVGLALAAARKVMGTKPILGDNAAYLSRQVG